MSVLILLVIIAMVSATTLQLGRTMHRRAAEQELLDIGTAFSDALDSYQRMTPAGRPATPHSLQDLLKDPRFPGTVRHLRELYTDPITGRNEWGIIQVAEGSGILGVYSLSEARPIKVANFDARFQNFNGKTSYRQWEFLSAQASATLAGAAGGNGGPAVPPKLISPSDLVDVEDPASAEKPKTTTQEMPASAPSNLISPLELR